MSKKLAEITLTGYTKKGHATCDAPKKIEVIGGVKGDLILAELIKRHQAKVLQVIKPSTQRVEPRCSHAGICGGCKWQQIDYNAQLLQKQEMVQQLFAQHTVNQVISCPNPWHYRSKMEFTFSQNKEGEKFLGLMKSNGRSQVESIETCHIAPLWMSQVLDQVRQWWVQSPLTAFKPHKGEGLLRTLTMRWGQSNDTKMVFLTVHASASDHLSKSYLDKFVEAVKIDEKTSVFLVVQHAEKGKETRFSEMHLAGPSAMQVSLLGQKFHLSPRAFFQPNFCMAEKMFSHLIEIVKQSGAQKVLDLYCGIGTIGILLAFHVRQVIGVELCAHSICDAKEVIEESGLENIQVFCQDAGEFLSEVQGMFKPDLIVVDPPRSGLGKKTIADLKRQAAKYLVYVSCNPRTQAEDCQELSDYEIELIQPYDQFAHTPHVETIVVLKRKELLID